MDALTRSSSARARNDAARGSVVCALLGLALPVAAFAAARQLGSVTLVQATAATCGSALLGLLALWLARRSRRNLERTLGRAGGRGTARAGRVLGVLALCVGCAAGLALGFYALLRYFG
jgi:membrane protein implicated in regulation of membrane protease activity